jgi:hypothetical protein
MLTEIYRCHACSSHEVEDGNGPDREVWAAAQSS